MSAWEFDDAQSPGWSAEMNLADVKVENSAMTASATGNDPAFATATDLEAARFRSVEIRMKVDKGAGAQLFWATQSSGFTEPASVKFDLKADGEFHVYRVNLADNPMWKSRITGLRFDPTDAAGAQIAVDYIKFLGRG